jgi:polyisoprenyl-phosphate glycosyltransferase
VTDLSLNCSPVNATLVVPCHNEHAVLATTARVLLELLAQQQRAGRCGPKSQVLFVDDGSTDQTWQLIGQLAEADPGRITGMRLARNVGHQYALLAGLTLAPGDVLISLDADLQDDVTAIPEMLDQYSRGYDIVYGVRSHRGTDTVFKRMTAAGFYRLMRRLGVDLVANHADYRLMSRRAIEVLRQYEEVNLFLRGIVRLIGLPSARVYYQRQPRLAGVTKYSLLQMCALAIQGITSFSVAPLRFISLLGLVTSVLALCGGGWVLYTALTNPAAVPGWASTLLPIMLIGGVQILSIGVLGEYVGKIYLETKRRPRFTVDQSIGVETERRPH